MNNNNILPLFSCKKVYFYLDLILYIHLYSFLFVLMASNTAIVMKRVNHDTPCGEHGFVRGHFQLDVFTNKITILLGGVFHEKNRYNLCDAQRRYCAFGSSRGENRAFKNSAFGACGAKACQKQQAVHPIFGTNTVSKAVR